MGYHVVEVNNAVSVSTPVYHGVVRPPALSVFLDRLAPGVGVTVPGRCGVPTAAGMLEGATIPSGSEIVAVACRVSLVGDNGVDAMCASSVGMSATLSDSGVIRCGASAAAAYPMDRGGSGSARPLMTWRPRKAPICRCRGRSRPRPTSGRGRQYVCWRRTSGCRVAIRGARRCRRGWPIPVQRHRQAREVAFLKGGEGWSSSGRSRAEWMLALFISRNSWVICSGGCAGRASARVDGALPGMHGWPTKRSLTRASLRWHIPGMPLSLAAAPGRLVASW